VDSARCEIRYRVAWNVMWILICLGFATPFAWLWHIQCSFLNRIDRQRYSAAELPDWDTIWMPFIVAVLLVAGSLRSAWRIFDRRPKIILDESGIHGPWIPSGPIPWDSIESYARVEQRVLFFATTKLLIQQKTGTEMTIGVHQLNYRTLFAELSRRL
jgi:hypothetical protein